MRCRAADWSQAHPCDGDMMDTSVETNSTPWSSLSGDVFSSVVHGSAQSLAPQLRLVCKDWKQLADENVETLQPSDVRCCTMFPRLASVDLSRCPASVDSSAMQALQSLAQLRDVNLQGCEQLTDEGMANLSGLSQLRTLSLSGCWQLTDSALEPLLHSLRGAAHQMASLTAVDFSSCLNLTGSGVANFLMAAGGSLTSLCLEDIHSVHVDPIGDHTLAAVSALPHLRSLNLAGITSFGELGMQHLAGLTGLTALDLGGCNQLTDVHLRHLGSLTSLEQLDLSVTGVSDGLLLALAQRMPRLKTLALGSCEMLVGSGLLALSFVAPQLEDLNMHSNMWVTDVSIRGLAGLTGLRRLNLGYCVALTDQGLGALAPITNLQELSLSGCLWVSCTPQGPQASSLLHSGSPASGPTQCPAGAEEHRSEKVLGPLATLQALTELDLSGSGLADEGLCQLSTMQRIGKLNLSGCSNITSCGVATAIMSLRGLHTINVDHCPRVCSSTTKTIMSSAGRLLPAMAEVPSLEAVAAC